MVRNAELTSFHQPEEFYKGQKERGDTMYPVNLPESSSLESILAEWCVLHQEGPWVRVIDQR